MTDATQVQNGGAAADVVPAAPATPAEAATRLDQLKADPKWTSALLAGGPTQAREFHSLHELVAKGDDADVAMSGALPEMPSSDLKEMAGTASMLRQIGIRDEITRDVLSGTHAVTQAEYDATARWKADHMSNPAWVKGLMSGGVQERRELALANIILTGEIKKEPAK